MENLCTASVNSAVGKIYVVCDELGLKEVSFTEPEKNLKSPLNDTALEHLKNAVKQIDEYLSGKRRTFSLTLNIKVTPFQKKVYDALNKVPYGKTISYSELACRINRPHAARAVGQAMRKNPVPLIIPCHRVLGKNGSLTGYDGPSGTHIKRWLLDLENTSL